MVSSTLKVKNEQGIHMRPAGLIAGVSKKFKGTEITLATADKTVKASLMQIMAAGIKCGTDVTISCSGPDEEAALAELVQMFEEGFGE